MIAKALHTVGDGGIVTVEESAAHGMSVDFVEGFEFENGYLSPYLVTNPASLEAIVDDPYILLCSEKITKVQQLMPLLDKIMRAPRPLVILAENVEGSALSMLVHNHVNGVFQCVAVRAPGFGDRRLHKLEDIAAITGGAVLQQALGVHPGDDDRRRSSAGPRRCGSTPTSTAIIGGGGSADAVRVPGRPAARGAGPGHLRDRRGRADRADRRAVGQGRGDQGRRAHQRRAEGAAAPGRGRAVGDQGGDGRGHRGGRRRRAAARRARRSTTLAGHGRLRDRRRRSCAAC